MLDAKHKSSYIEGMANKLPLAKRVQILSMMVEGSSMRSISRVCDVSINTVSKLLVDAGEACLDMHDELVRGVKSKRVECDEIWSFIHTKAKNKAKSKNPDSADTGDVWTWTAIDADSKLMISYLAGQRSAKSGEAFMRDLAGRVTERVQLTTDGFGVYAGAVEKAFGGAVDHAMLVKIYANVPAPGETRYSPLECVGTKTEICCGNPDKAHVSTSYVERANLTIRMGNRRFTRLTNAHSKKYANHLYALALFFMHYNFVRVHKSLRMSPAMAAGVSDTLWTMEDTIARIDERAPKPGPRGPYKKKAA